MGYTTTLAILTHNLHDHVDRCMRKIIEVVALTWDETVDNVWHKISACDHLLDLKSWKKGDLPPGQGISYAADTRHLRILRRRLEEVMGKSVRFIDPTLTRHFQRTVGPPVVGGSGS